MKAAVRAVSASGSFRSKDLRYVQIDLAKGTSSATFNEDRFYPEKNLESVKNGTQGKIHLEQELPFVMRYSPENFPQLLLDIVITPVGLSSSSNVPTGSESDEWWVCCESLPGELAEVAFPISVSEIRELKYLEFLDVEEETAGYGAESSKAAVLLMEAVQAEMTKLKLAAGRSMYRPLKTLLKSWFRQKLEVEPGLDNLYGISMATFQPEVQELKNVDPREGNNRVFGQRFRRSDFAGSLLTPEYDFPFYRISPVKKNHSTKQLFSVDLRNCQKFGSVLRHGTKVLYPSGVASFVGIAPEDMASGRTSHGIGGGNNVLQFPLPYWYQYPRTPITSSLVPSSPPTGCLLIPEVHSDGLMPNLKKMVVVNGGKEECAEGVGAVSAPRNCCVEVGRENLLGHNGPAEELQDVIESPSRFLFTEGGGAGAGLSDGVDQSKWLNDGLFGANVGENIPGRGEEWRVSGIQLGSSSTDRSRLELMCEKKKLIVNESTSSTLTSVEDVILFS